MKKILKFVLVANLSICPIFADTFDLGKIDVSSLKEGTKFDSSVITEDDMKKTESNSITQALDMVSGVSIYNLGARNEQMVNVRGFDVKHVPLYIDGIPIAVAYDGYVDFSRFTTFDLSQIEISKGLSSALLGVNTFAGAINLVTKKPTKEFEGVISGGMFSGNGKKGYLNLGTNQGNYYAQISTSYLQRDNFPMSDNFTATTREDGDKREQSDAKDTKINVKIGYTPNKTDEYAINYIKQKADKGVPVNVDITQTARYWDWNYWDKDSIYFLSKTYFDTFYLKSRLFYDRFRNSLSIYTDDTYSTYSYGGVGNPSWYDDNTKGISLEIGELIEGSNDIKLALHTKKDVHTEGGAGLSTSYEMSVNTYSIGLEDRYSISNSIKVIVGVSYDKDSVQKADNTNYGSTGSYGTTPNGTDISGYGTLQEFAKGDSDAINPMIKIEHIIDDSLKVYGGIAKKTRFPSIKDRYSFKFKRFVPNPDLKEESTINYEVGFRKNFENSTLKFNIFYADIKDFIQSDYVNIYYGTTQQQQLLNIGKVSQKGAELEYYYTFENGLDVQMNYTYIDIKDKDEVNQIINVPKNKLSMALMYEPIQHLKTNLNMQYTSSKKTTSTSPYNETGGLVVWNTKMVYDISKYLSYDIGINNIFDRNYQLDYGFPEAGRNLYTNLTYKF